VTYGDKPEALRAGGASDRAGCNAAGAFAAATSAAAARQPAVSQQRLLVFMGYVSWVW
jgi:hypothetical protein